MDIEGQVKKVISEQLGIEVEEIKTEAKFVEDLGADSLDIVEMIMSLEDIFEIEISDEAAEKIQTVQNAIDFISSGMQAG